MRGCWSMLLQLTTEQSAGRVGGTPCPNEERAIVIARRPQLEGGCDLVAMGARWREPHRFPGPGAAVSKARCLGIGITCLPAFVQHHRDQHWPAQITEELGKHGQGRCMHPVAVQSVCAAARTSRRKPPPAASKFGFNIQAQARGAQVAGRGLKSGVVSLMMRRGSLDVETSRLGHTNCD